MKTTIDLYYKNGDDLLNTFEELNKLNISVKVLKAKGPGGGWPIIELNALGGGKILNGPEKKLKEWLIKNDFKSSTQ